MVGQMEDSGVLGAYIACVFALVAAVKSLWCIVMCESEGGHVFLHGLSQITTSLPRDLPPWTISIREHYHERNTTRPFVIFPCSLSYELAILNHTLKFSCWRLLGMQYEAVVCSGRRNVSRMGLRGVHPPETWRYSLLSLYPSLCG
ncbi:hypothetical protein F4805DRAFT_183716 [Annulohypoxylon moriforme]|nr:hypothetical protein F4805DRAFT_183716 [Annulohypoxylon moriforme]